MFKIYRKTDEKSDKDINKPEGTKYSRKIKEDLMSLQNLLDGSNTESLEDKIFEL